MGFYYHHEAGLYDYPKPGLYYCRPDVVKGHQCWILYFLLEILQFFGNCLEILEILQFFGNCLEILEILQF